MSSYFMKSIFQDAFYWSGCYNIPLNPAYSCPHHRLSWTRYKLREYQQYLYQNISSLHFTVLFHCLPERSSHEMHSKFQSFFMSIVCKCFYPSEKNARDGSGRPYWSILCLRFSLNWQEALWQNQLYAQYTSPRQLQNIHIRISDIFQT